MKISKWVDMGQEVEIEIGVDDIRASLAHCFSAVADERIFSDDTPSVNEVIYAFSSIGTFLNAITDDQIALLNAKQREVISQFLNSSAVRFSGFQVATEKVEK